MTILSICVALWSLFASPSVVLQQDTLGHLQFLNAEIINVDVVESVVVAKGYSRLSPVGNPNSVFSGSFCGIDNARIRLYPMDMSLHGSAVVWKVSVDFPVQDSWIAAKERYAQLKEMLFERYDVEPVSTEKLSKRYPEGDDREKWGFEKFYSKWESIFPLPEGDIILSVKFDNRKTLLYVSLDYVDKINYIMKHSSDIENL